MTKRFYKMIINGEDAVYISGHRGGSKANREDGMIAIDTHLRHGYYYYDDVVTFAGLINNPDEIDSCCYKLY